MWFTCFYIVILAVTTVIQNVLRKSRIHDVSMWWQRRLHFVPVIKYGKDSTTDEQSEYLGDRSGILVS